MTKKKVKATEPGFETLLKQWPKSKLYVYCDAYGKQNWQLTDNYGGYLASNRFGYDRYAEVIADLEIVFRCKLKVDK